MIAEVEEDDQYGIRSTGLSTYTEEEEALDEDGDDDDNFSEWTKYSHEEILDDETYCPTRHI